MQSVRGKKMPNSITPIESVLFFAPFLLGCFFEFTAAVLTCVFSVLISVYAFRKKMIYVPLDWGAVAVFVMVLFYGLTAFWAVDRGMAIFGFVKFLPLLLYIILLAQTEKQAYTEALQVLPWSGGLMTILSFALSFLPSLGTHFVVAQRMAGFFEYPNTFALFLLLGLIVLGTAEKLHLRDLFLATVLLFGLFKTGSRTVFFLLLCCALCIGIFRKNKKLRIAVVILTGAAVVLSLAVAFLTDNMQTVGRYLTSSLSSSTLLGRLLYYKDALPIILHHPFGLGYKGYYYMHPSFQTGVYSVLYVHNDFLQLLLDVGWLPAGLMGIAVSKAFLQRGASLRTRLLLFALVAHSMVDFDLQYLAISLILVTLLPNDRRMQVELTKQRFIPAAVCTVLVGISLYFGTASFAAYLGNYEASLRIYKNYTDSYVALLTAESDLERANALALKITENNQYVAAAYDTRALYAYAQGNFEKVISYKEKSISIAPYRLEAYTTYIDMLQTGEKLYLQAGDKRSAAYCRSHLENVGNLLQQTVDKTDPLAWKIKDKPYLELPAEYAQKIHR